MYNPPLMATDGCLTELPAWERSGPVGRAIEMAGLVAAPLLLIAHVGRLSPVDKASVAPDLLVVALALVCADFTSGIVHWIADTAAVPLILFSLFLQSAVTPCLQLPVFIARRGTRCGSWL